VNGLQGAGVLVAQFLAELQDYLVQGAGGAVIIIASNLVEQLVAGQHFAGMGMKDLEQF
jgi:hypothetical protein